MLGQATRYWSTRVVRCLLAITDGSQAPATFPVASHCVDDLAHGLLPGPHENWFTWSLG